MQAIFGSFDDVKLGREELFWSWMKSWVLDEELGQINGYGF